MPIVATTLCINVPEWKLVVVASSICGPVETRLVVRTPALHILLALLGCGAAVDCLTLVVSGWCVCLGVVDGWAADLYLFSTVSGQE